MLEIEGVIFWFNFFTTTKIYYFFQPLFSLEEVKKPSRYFQNYLQVVARLTYIGFYLFPLVFVRKEYWFITLLVFSTNIACRASTSNVRLQRSRAISRERDQGIEKSSKDPKFYQWYIILSGGFQEGVHTLAIYFLGGQSYKTSFCFLLLQIGFGICNSELMYLRDKAIYNNDKKKG